MGRLRLSRKAAERQRKGHEDQQEKPITHDYPPRIHLI
jgi:hypothetical protein